MSGPPPTPDDAPDGPGTAPDEAATQTASAALRAAFDRMAPQGSDTWNYLAAFTHLGDRFGPYKPGTSDLARLLTPPEGGGAGGGGSGGGGAKGRLGRIRQMAAGGAPAAPEEQSEFQEAMAHVIEAFRFLAARVLTLEDRLARQDRPVDGSAWLVLDEPLGEWVRPVVDHLAAAAPDGEVLHADCGEGDLLSALAEAGVEAIGVEPRGGVALIALERGHEVAINEVADEMPRLPAGSLGGLVLTGAVDRLPLHALIDLLAHARRVLAPGAPLVVVSSEPAEAEARWDAAAHDLVGGRPLHAPTWQVLLERAGFSGVSPLSGPDAAGGRFGVTAAAPA